MCLRMLITLQILLFFCPTSPALALEKLVLGHSPSVSEALNVIAKNHGFFAREGLDVELRDMGSGNLAVDAMLNDKIDVAESTTFALVDNAFRRKDFQIYATMTVSGNYNVIVARGDRGLKTVRDLKGKKVGVLKNGYPSYVLDLMLFKAGLSPKDVKIVQDEIRNLPQRIASGELDAVCVFGNWIDKTQKLLGGSAVIFHDPDLLKMTIVQAAKKDKLAKRPDLFVRLLKAYIRAEEYVKKNPDAALKEVVKELGLDMTRTIKVWKPNLFHVGLDQSMIKDMENMAHWQLESGMHAATRIPDYIDFINFRIIETIDPKRIRIVH